MGNLATKVPTLSELAADINENHELALMYVGQSFDHAVKAGLLLIEAKAQFPHGGWLNWLKANVKVGVRQAQNYMKVATRPDEIRNGVAHLSLRKAIHALALQKVEKESDSAPPAPEPKPKAKPVEPTDPPTEPTGMVGDEEWNELVREGKECAARIRAVDKIFGSYPKDVQAAIGYEGPFEPDDDGDDGNLGSALVVAWDVANADVRDHLLQHIRKESDIIAEALALVQMMDKEQLRRFCVILDAYKMRRDKKQASTLAQGGAHE